MAILFFVFFVSIFLAFSSTLKAETSYLSELKILSEEKELSSTPKWRALVHYWDNWVDSGYESFADDEEFFLSIDGKSNSKAELFATLDAFFEKPRSNNDNHAICSFPARFDWLNSKLNFDKNKLPQVECEELNLWFSGLAPLSLTLVFPATYLNSPASSFGHTFLRIDSESSSNNTGPLAYVANYGADTTDPVGFSYAMKGIFGLYNGNFSVAPYYKLLKRYGDFENRDIWEYKLRFSKNEVDFLLKHLWELKGKDFDYYFFGENCSFLILSLFDVVRPELKLQERFPFWAIPLDTIREVLKDENILESAEFRASLKTRFLSRVKQASSEEKKVLKSLLKEGYQKVNFEKDELSSSEKAKVLDLALDYLSLPNTKAGFLNNDSEEYSEKKLRKFGYELLLERSKIKEKSVFFEAKAPSLRPDQGHLTKKFEIGLGYESDSLFYDFNLRPAYHDLLSPEEGFIFGSELRVFETTLRAYEEEGLKLQRFSPLTIKSLSPANEFLNENSWSFEAALERKRVPSKEFEQAFELEELQSILGVDAYYGKARNIISDNTLGYLLLGVRGEYENTFDDNFAFGPGVSAGLIILNPKSFRLNLRAEATHFALGDKHEEGSLGIDSNFTITRNLALAFEAERVKKFDLYYNRVRLALEAYF